VFEDLEPGFNEVGLRIGSHLTPAFAEQFRGMSPYERFTINQPWPAVDITITRLICQTYMLEMGLAQGDRLSMASSVELRLPLVDYRLVETVIGLRKTYRDLELSPKQWLRDAVRNVIPGFVLSRRKRGFTPPWRKWARACARAFGDLLPGGYLVQQGILRPEAARRMAQQLAPSTWGMPDLTADHCLALEMWCRQMTQVAPTPSNSNPSRWREASDVSGGPGGCPPDQPRL
jgi:asparagine synthase (glutamine-hydrolysing)